MQLATRDGRMCVFDLDAVSLNELAPVFGTALIVHNAAFECVHLTRAGMKPAEVKTVNVKDKIATPKEEMAQLKTIEVQMQEASDRQVSLTDPDVHYFKRADILLCHEAGITAKVPRSQNFGYRTKVFFGRKDFYYAPEKDEY